MSRPATDMSVIIPSHNEEGYIGRCLDALLVQVALTLKVEVILMANACTDGTVRTAVAKKALFKARGWKLRVLQTRTPGKLNALNCADRAATGAVRVYLDADVVCAPLMLQQLNDALDVDAPRYASGKLQVAPAQSWVTRQYARFWQRLPFMQTPAVGAGLFAVNRAGRARWGAFPAIISDDTFVRLQFTPQERVEVKAAYLWPMVEGFANLVKVRRRQDAGVAEISRVYPGLLDREGKARPDYLRLCLADPVGFVVYVAVTLAVKRRKANDGWTRGR